MSAPITLTGRLGSDPEMRFSASGTAVVSLRVVTNTRWNDNGEWKDKDTTWWQVTAFKQLAENVTESLRKGDLVVIVGRVFAEDWETKEGEKRTTFKVIADHIGPDLSRATAKVTKNSVGGTAPAVAGDPWADQGAEAPF